LNNIQVSLVNNLILILVSNYNYKKCKQMVMLMNEHLLKM